VGTKDGYPIQFCATTAHKSRPAPRTGGEIPAAD
jgi:hypothetical protein